MSDIWISLYEEFPNIKGYHLHVLTIPDEDLKSKLEKIGFTVYKIDGSKIVDEPTFFNEVKLALPFPDYFGKNWNAWDDSLSEFLHSSAKHVAIIWEQAANNFSGDPQTFLQALGDLYSLVYIDLMESRSLGKHLKQLEIFIVI